MQEMRDMADRNREAAAHARSELTMVRKELERLESGKNEYESKVKENVSLWNMLIFFKVLLFFVFVLQLAAAEKKIKDLQDQLKTVESDFYSRLRMREDEIHRLQDEIATMMKEYQDLMDTKIQLSVEIEAYRRLIEGEEMRYEFFFLKILKEFFLKFILKFRLHLSPTPGATTEGEKRGTKRRRVLEEKETSEQDTYEVCGNFCALLFYSNNTMFRNFDVSQINNNYFFKKNCFTDEARRHWRFGNCRT